jgi:hypothetical protein
VGDNARGSSADWVKYLIGGTLKGVLMFAESVQVG